MRFFQMIQYQIHSLVANVLKLVIITTNYTEFIKVQKKKKTI